MAQLCAAVFFRLAFFIMLIPARWIDNTEVCIGDKSPFREKEAEKKEKNRLSIVFRLNQSCALFFLLLFHCRLAWTEENKHKQKKEIHIFAYS